MLTVQGYLKSLTKSDQVRLTRSHRKFHELTGKTNNNSRREARMFFAAYVDQNSAPNGRTQDSYGRYNGAPNYLDPKFELMVHDERREISPDLRRAFADEAVAAMKTALYFAAHPNALIKPRTAAEWLKEMYGKRILRDGEYVYNPKYTTLYPHETDACGECERFKGDIALRQRVAPSPTARRPGS